MTATSPLALLASSGETSDERLSWITHTARATLAGVDGVSITLVEGRALRTIGATDPLVEAADAQQYRLGEGPSIDASLGVPLSHANDVGKDLRWQAYGRAVAELGIHAQTAIPLCAEGRLVGVLNLYSTQPGPLDEGVLEAAMRLANAAGELLWMTRRLDAVAQATAAGPDVAAATRIVMQRYRLDEERAFHCLVQAAATSRVRLRQVAKELRAGATGGSDLATGAAAGLLDPGAQDVTREALVVAS